jgi:GNAT superfamily N-acetyltransferase
MRTIESLLGAAPERKAPYLLRPHQPGDMGWIVHRQAVLYTSEYGWDEQFEALIAGIAAKFIKEFDAKRERCWIAERDGEIVGSVFLVKQSEEVAKLRLLYVERTARGLGIGSGLVGECVRFARQSGYRRIVLWTNSVLTAARHLYEEAGFVLTHEEPHHSFGHDLVGETWELTL